MKLFGQNAKRPLGVLVICKLTPWGFNFALLPPGVYGFVKLTPQLNNRLVFC